MAVFEASDMESLGKQADRWLGTNDRSAMLVVRSDAEKNARVMLDLVNGK